MYESVAKLPCGEVTVAKLPCGEVTGNRCLYLGKANLMQKICKRGPQSSEIFGQKLQ